MRASRFFPLLLLAIITILVWWLEALFSGSQPETIEQQNNDPALYMKNFIQHNFSTNGELHYQTKGQSLIHIPPENDDLEIEHVNIHSYKNDKPPIFIKSNKAYISNNGKHITLTGAIYMHQRKLASKDSLSIQT